MDINNYNTASELLKDFRPVTLAGMDQVKLMDRMDRKFVLPFNKLPAVLKNLSPHYSVLTIGDKCIFSYQTDYFDTPGMDMFSDHHNGKQNRYKIRQRAYIESEICFIEVKFKSNKGRVIKNRIEKTYHDRKDFDGFVRKYTPYQPDYLQIIISNRFNRFTMVDNGFKERVTVDFNLEFSDLKQSAGINGLVIIEVKQNKNSRQSMIYNALRENGLRPESFSKYCLGVSLLQRHIKLNNFKQTINLINKLSHVELSA